jgi:hypothetical protein
LQRPGNFQASRKNHQSDHGDQCFIAESGEKFGSVDAFAVEFDYKKLEPDQEDEQDQETRRLAGTIAIENNRLREHDCNRACGSGDIGIARMVSAANQTAVTYRL